MSSISGIKGDRVSGEGDVRRPADSADRAYRQIRKQLIEFKIRPEERINEVHLARALELSRTPVREALNRLASEGFVLFRPNRGFYFRSLDIGDLLDLFEMRMIVETGAFALLCARVDDEGLTRLRTYWEDAKLRYARKDGDEILDLDEGFHILMAELSGNPEIVRNLHGLNARIRFIRRVQIEHSPHDLLDSHNRIVDAAGRRAADEGVALLKAHISMTVADAQAALKEALLQLFVTDTRRSSQPAGRLGSGARKGAAI